MTRVNAYRKGKGAELEVAAMCAEHGFTARRTPGSGGLGIPCDLRGMEGIAWEVKRQERLNIWAALDQAQRQAAPGETPALAFRRSQGSWFVAIPLKDFLGVLAELRNEEQETLAWLRSMREVEPDEPNEPEAA